MADETNRNDTQQQDLGELLRIRREKLKALQDEGRDPFQITKFDVTHHTQDIKTTSTLWRAARYPWAAA